MLYTIRFFHRISPSDKDVKEVKLDEASAFADKASIAKALREAGVLAKGDRIRGFRVEGDKCIVFPAKPSPWHAITIVQKSEDSMPKYFWTMGANDGSILSGSGSLEDAIRFAKEHQVSVNLRDAAGESWKSMGWVHPDGEYTLK